MRRVVYLALFAVIAATMTVVATAQQANTNKQVTLVMKNGERHSGILVYNNDGNFNLIDNGQDKRYPIEEVAVVDFAGGEPTAAELKELPTADGSRSDLDRHMLSLRDGTVVRGRMYTVKPSTITFNTESGHRDFDLNNVSRIYINPGTSRRLYASTLNAAAPASSATGTAGQNVPAGAIQVEAARQWTDTNILVRRGDRLIFSATGQVAIRANAGAADMLGPDGSPTEARTGAPTSAIGVGGLIGRIGTGAPFAIGSNSQPITMPASGRLYLGVNDAGASDNSGAFTVTVVR
jgi:small nuclear ribonucleoprotein (snRNP)-like protein